MNSNNASAFDQIPLFEVPAEEQSYPAAPENLLAYDYYLVMMSGGKDSLACLLHLIEAGVPLEKIELWHHSVDGLGNTNPLMDWPVTESYNRALASAFKLPIYFSARNGGFEAEMLRKDSLTASCSYETPDGELVTTGGTPASPTHALNSHKKQRIFGLVGVVVI